MSNQNEESIEILDANGGYHHKMVLLRKPPDETWPSDQDLVCIADKMPRGSRHPFGGIVCGKNTPNEMWVKVFTE